MSDPMYYNRTVRDMVATDWKDAYEQGHHATDALRDALGVMSVLLDRITALETEREQIRAALKGYADSDLASLAETLTLRNEALEQEIRRLHTGTASSEPTYGGLTADELRALARAANPAPRKAVCHREDIGGVPHKWWDIAVERDGEWYFMTESSLYSEADARYDVAAHPQTMIDLLDESARLRAALDDCRSTIVVRHGELIDCGVCEAVHAIAIRALAGEASDVE